LKQGRGRRHSHRLFGFVPASWPQKPVPVRPARGTPSRSYRRSCCLSREQDSDSPLKSPASDLPMILASRRTTDTPSTVQPTIRHFSQGDPLVVTARVQPHRERVSGRRGRGVASQGNTLPIDPGPPVGTRSPGRAPRILMSYLSGS
jgi:hypothetical protein